MRLISKEEQLPVGTKVRVGNRYGTVHSIKNGKHMITFTHQQYIYPQRYRTDSPRFNMVEINHKIEPVINSAIMVL